MVSWMNFDVASLTREILTVGERRWSREADLAGLA